MNESTAGDPMSHLKWTHKSTYAIAKELQIKGHIVSHDTVRRLLKEEGYSLQANKKAMEGITKKATSGDDIGDAPILDAEYSETQGQKTFSTK
jgi:transposase